MPSSVPVNDVTLTSRAVKYWIRIDDSMDVFAEHGVAGMLGLLANAIFGADYIVALDGVNAPFHPLGWIQHNWKQLYIQFAYVVAATAYAFVVSAIIAFIIDKIPGLHLRASEEAELLGMDDDQLGEFAYDYVEVRRDYLAWTPAKEDPSAALEESSSIPQNERHGIGAHSQMLEGKDPEKSSESEDNNHTTHHYAQGDRHGMAYEQMKKEERQSGDR